MKNQENLSRSNVNSIFCLLKLILSSSNQSKYFTQSHLIKHTIFKTQISQLLIHRVLYICRLLRRGCFYTIIIIIIILFPPVWGFHQVLSAGELSHWASRVPATIDYLGYLDFLIMIILMMIILVLIMLIMIIMMMMLWSRGIGYHDNVFTIIIFVDHILQPMQWLIVFTWCLFSTMSTMVNGDKKTWRAVVILVIIP